MNKQVYSIELEERQYKFLEDMADRNQLPDVGKAVRCLVDYACENADQQDSIFSEIRCLDC